MSIEVSFTLEASLAGIRDEMAGMRKDWRRLEDAYSHIPADYPITGSGTTPALPTPTTPTTLPPTAGIAIILCQGPQTGRQWMLRQLLVAGPTAGAVYFYATASKPITHPLQIIGMKDTTKTRWPCPAFYGTHQFILNPREDLWVVVTTAGNSTPVVVSGTAEDYQPAANRATWSE